MMVSSSRVILFAVVLLVLLGLTTHSTYAGSGDEPHYLAIAHSIAFDLDFDVSNNYGAAEPLIADGQLQPEDHARAGRGGVLRPVHDVGMPLVLAPVVRAAAPVAAWIAARMPPTLMQRLTLTPSGLYRHILEAAMAMLGAALACLLFESFMNTGSSRHLAFWLALLVALSPPLLIYSTLLFTETTSAFLCLAAFRTVALRDHSDTWHWIFAGLATGLLLLTHTRNIGAIAGLVTIVGARVITRRALGSATAFFSPIAAFVALRTAINYHFWGTYITNPHARLGAWMGWLESARIGGTRLAGLLLDQEFGLLPYAPVFIIAIYGAAAAWRNNRALASAIALVVGGYLIAVMLPITNAHGWTGGWSPAARFMTPIVPILALGLATGVRVLPRTLVSAIVIVQVALNVYFWQHPKNLWNDGDGRAAICQRGGFPGCAYLPSFAAEPQ